MKKYRKILGFAHNNDQRHRPIIIIIIIIIMVIFKCYFSGELIALTEKIFKKRKKKHYSNKQN